MSDWQAIETAPKDGTRILLYEPPKSWQGKRGLQEWVVLGYWHQPGNPEVAGSWCGSSITDQYRPTHWMPLPDAPK